MTTNVSGVEAGSRKRSRRFVQILDLVAERGEVSLAELAETLRISPATARGAVELTRHRLLTIVTNSLTIAELAHTHPALRVVVTGGLLRPQSLELVGTLAERTFGALNVGTAILGADGIAASAGVT